MSRKILWVDDDANLLAGIHRTLRKQFEIETAVGAAAALQQLAQRGPFAVLVADMQMPGMSGLELLALVEKRAPDTVRIMLTGNSDQKTAMAAVNDGHVFRFLTKPCTPATLVPVLEAALEHHRHLMAERELLEKTVHGTVKILVEVLSFRFSLAD